MTEAEKIAGAMKAYDESMARCPVNNPKFGRVFGPDDRCPYCSAKASGSCGISSGAGWHLAQACRAILDQSK